MVRVRDARTAWAANTPVLASGHVDLSLVCPLDVTLFQRGDRVSFPRQSAQVFDELPVLALDLLGLRERPPTLVEDFRVKNHVRRQQRSTEYGCNEVVPVESTCT